MRGKQLGLGLAKHNKLITLRICECYNTLFLLNRKNTISYLSLN
jgi:hypothetical protein